MVDLLGWPFGLLLSFIASIVGVLGKIMIKLSFRPSVALESSEATCWWGGGMALIVVVNPALCISAYKFAPQSLLAPMGGLCVVWNTVLSPYILNETLRTREVFTTPLVYVVGLAALGFAMSGLYLMNMALHLYDALFVIYIYEATLLMGGAISGICFFGDMKDLSGWHWGVYSAGIAFILVGIVVLSTGDRPLSLSEGDHHQYNDDLHAVKQTLL
ncbi:hypothetical protein DYB37_004722 [Aphanomyces astaci]|uniref:EamA domain-containing protein n=1 Tax=Aphanomyces astaci TaxID=112090 RepID=A0A397AIU7_APHAT|nr:hypothetical protein DYB36_008834 [Aphanomyces astaci]RHY05708.1 hypothetical protein DYB25_010066 [Aphanomyces astaci]RHY43736.1 hypothetical protein DYB34_010627 [Aphanomyces astaci]RHY59088.1 hypothetical protein DYB30_008062 [Aphanomyces astaci]RHY69895.1 hypothetical protein DYB38_008625 [Aphanomyces astaci]